MLMTSCFGGSTSILGRKRITLLQPLVENSNYGNKLRLYTFNNSIYVREFEYFALTVKRCSTIEIKVRLQIQKSLFQFTKV